MIESKEDFKRYMAIDAIALGYKPRKMVLIGRPIWRFERALRHLEYNFNVTHNMVKIIFWKLVHRHLMFKLGYQILPNTVGGMRLNHFGLVIINSEARIGEWADIHQGVNIGTGYDGCPIIGNNVWIGPGVKIFNNIEIADNIAIGANAVVNKSFLERGISIAGIPAVKVSDKGNQYLRMMDEADDK